ncbi:hypothetical protein ACH5RR_003641 [Cinchona calisaya]
MQNSLPVITFIIASSMGLEQVNIARRDGLTKILRTIASVGCATIITFTEVLPFYTRGYKSNMLEEDVFLFNEKAAAAELDMGQYLLAWALLILGWLDGSSGDCVFRNCHLASNLVYLERRSNLCCHLPASCFYGICNSWRSVLQWRLSERTCEKKKTSNFLSSDIPNYYQLLAGLLGQLLLWLDSI